MINPEEKKVADILWHSLIHKTPCLPPRHFIPHLDIHQAYAISEYNFNKRLAHFSSQPIGKKIGLTSKSIQQWLKVNEPDFGFLSQDMLISQGDHVHLNQFIQPKIEAEIAFILKQDLNASTPIGLSDVLNNTAYIIPALEIIDSRVENWKITLEDTVSDNASCGAVVLGDPIAFTNCEDLTTIGMTLRRNGKVVSTGAGAACLDHPALAVAWLANTLHRYGQRLRANEVILSGALGPTSDLSSKDFFEAQLFGLGTVSCQVN